MTNTFWLNNPAILFDNNHITELWPSSNLDYISKLNAVTRLVILLTMVGFFTSGFFKILVSAGVTLVIIVMMYKSKRKETVEKKIKEQRFYKPQFIQSDKTVVYNSYCKKPTWKCSTSRN